MSDYTRLQCFPVVACSSLTEKQHILSTAQLKEQQVHLPSASGSSPDIFADMQKSKMILHYTTLIIFNWGEGWGFVFSSTPPRHAGGCGNDTHRYRDLVIKTVFNPVLTSTSGLNTFPASGH